MCRVNEGKKKVMVLDWGQSEMVENRCLEDLEGRMRLNRMWKLVHRWGKREEQMSGGEQ